MWNVLTLSGAIVMLLGAWLVLHNLVAMVRAGARWWRSLKPPTDGSMWGMADSFMASLVYRTGRRTVERRRPCR